jgi:site-specific DNA-methyltransferase (adenine-specific)/site-specific DNA-methyltransferase (cytosine-N4-specific)
MSQIVLEGNVRKVLEGFPEGFFHCAVTSPPYYGLRQYFFEGAVCIKPSLSKEQKDYVIAELNKIGVRQKNGGA